MNIDENRQISIGIIPTKISNIIIDINRFKLERVLICEHFKCLNSLSESLQCDNTIV